MTADQLAALVALGLTPEQLVGVVRIVEQDVEERRAYERERKRRWRDKTGTSRHVPGTSQGQDGTPLPPLSPPPSSPAPSPTSPPIIPPSPSPPAEPANENKPKPSAIRVDWSDFDAFWLAYPRKVDKKAAKRVWEREVRKGVRPELITIAARRYGELMKDSEPQFVKHPSTWLNATEFEDDRLWPNDPRAGPDLAKLTPSQRAMIEGLRLVAEET